MNVRELADRLEALGGELVLAGQAAIELRRLADELVAAEVAMRDVSFKLADARDPWDGIESAVFGLTDAANRAMLAVVLDSQAKKDTGASRDDIVAATDEIRAAWEEVTS